MKQNAMTPRERLQAVLDGRIPDRVPHFELVFQLEKEATGKTWPSSEVLLKASAKEKEYWIQEYLDLWETIIDRYGWSAVPLPVHVSGLEQGQIIQAGRKRFGDKVLIFDFNGEGTFWMPSGSEIMAFTVMLFEEPEKAHELARKKRDQSIRLARLQVDQGVDFIVINSDYGFNQGPFISPAMFAEFVTPYLAEIVDQMHQFGTRAILHSDGDLRKILDQLVSTGLDGYQSVDPQGNMDIAQVKQQYGDRLILMGNVQASLLQDEDETRIRESVRYCMTHAKPGGRYIFSTSNCIFAGMPLHNYDVMLDEFEKLAAYD